MIIGKGHFKKAFFTNNTQCLIKKLCFHSIKIRFVFLNNSLIMIFFHTLPK